MVQSTVFYELGNQYWQSFLKLVKKHLHAIIVFIRYSTRTPLRLVIAA